MGILMKNGVNYTGFGAKNIAVAHYDSIGIPQVFFSDKAGNKINCGADPRYITTITTDPIAFFKWKLENDGAWVGYGAISLRPLTYGTDYSHNTEWADLVDPLTLSINGVTVYVYREKGAWAFSNNPNVVINDTYTISTNYATDNDITANSKFIKDIVATLTDGYILPQEAVVRYSTEERTIGTWIDGKPVYQKTFLPNYQSSYSSGIHEINVPIDIHDLNVDTVVNLFGVWERYTGDLSRLLYHFGSGENQYGDSWLRVDSENGYHNGRLNATIISENTDWQCVTIQYTKTTD